MANNSLITSFFTSPNTTAGALQLTPVNTSPILLSPDSLESLESLSLQEKLSPTRRVYLPQTHLSELNSSIAILSECSLVEEDGSLLLLEDNTDECIAMRERNKQQKQSTLSGLFQTPPISEPVECGPNKREKRKAAIRASQQMTDLLTRHREVQVNDRNAVASIFLSKAEKKRLREQSLEEERRPERIQKQEEEAERIKYKAFLKFATEPLLSSKTAKPASSQTTELTVENLWTALKHVTQLSTETEGVSSNVPLQFVVPSYCPALDSVRTNYDILKLESDERAYCLHNSEVKLLTEREMDSRVSELAVLFPALPVKELFSLYLSLTYLPDLSNTAALSNQIPGAESKKRTRKGDTDNPLSFRSKRRRNQFPPPSNSADCIIVDSFLESCTPSSFGEAVLWTDKLLPPVSRLLLSDASAVGRMKEFLREWQKEDATYSTENSNSSTRQKDCLADSSDDDFEVFIKKKLIHDEDTRDSFDQALSGTMLLTGGVSSGKTSSVYVMAMELGMRVLEINTCMNRSGKDLQLCLSEATQSFRVTASENKTNSKVLNNKDNNCISYPNHFGKLNPKTSKQASKELSAAKLTLTDDTIILIDEVDLLFEPEKGFWPAFQQIAGETKLPIFLTANELSDYDVVPDIFTNHTFFQPITVSKLSLLIHLVFLVQKINIPKSMATDIAIYFWPDYRQIINLLQFWLTPSTHHIVPKNVKYIERFLSPYVMRTELLVFNMHTLSSPFIYKVIPKNNSPVKEYKSKHKRPQLRIQYRASSAISSLDIYQSKLMLSSYRSPLATAKFGDGFCSDTLPSYTCSFHQSLCNDLIATQCDLIRQLSYSQDYFNNFTEDYIEILSSEARDFDKKRNWENSLKSVSKSILPERVNSTRDYGEHYLPYLKSMCSSEEDRQICNRRRRRFKHYLSSYLTSNLIDSLTDSELAS